MKVIVEADLLAHDPQTGVYYYTQRLVAAAAGLDADLNYELVYFGESPELKKRLGISGPNVKARAITWLPRKVYNALLRTPFRLPFDLVARTDGDIYLFPRFVRWPLWRNLPSVVIVPDTAYLDFPEVLKTSHFRWYLQKSVPRGLKKATRVIAISESTKRSLINHYGTPASKISVITPALDHEQFKPAPVSQISTVKQKYGITKNYILYLGAIEPRKNIPGIIAAYRSLPAELRQQYQLVFGGGASWGDIDVAPELATGELIQTGFIAPEDIASLYSGATVFIYPSLFEGWGMQILEAMACGTPVLTSDNSSLPEAGGKAATYAKSGDQDSLNTKLLQLLSSPSRLAKLKALGIEHAKTFTWETSAQELVDLLKTLKH